jgi:hypothetical protein
LVDRASIYEESLKENTAEYGDQKRRAQELLTALTKKNTHFVWTEECEHSFQTLKKPLATAPVLALPMESGNFVVYSDTSKKGLGCMLTQNDNVIAYAHAS